MSDSKQVFRRTGKNFVIVKKQEQFVNSPDERITDDRFAQM